MSFCTINRISGTTQAHHASCNAAGRVPGIARYNSNINREFSAKPVIFITDTAVLTVIGRRGRSNPESSYVSWIFALSGLAMTSPKRWADSAFNDSETRIRSPAKDRNLPAELF